MSQTCCKSDCDSDAQEHLSELQALCLELEAATLALAGNESSKFLVHLDRLEFRCACLRQSLQKAIPRADSLGCPVDVSRVLADNIRAAHLDLNRLSYGFSALLRRRSRSVSLLSRHHHSLSGSIMARPAFPTERTTLSAEV